MHFQNTFRESQYIIICCLINIYPLNNTTPDIYQFYTWYCIIVPSEVCVVIHMNQMHCIISFCSSIFLNMALNVIGIMANVILLLKCGFYPLVLMWLLNWPVWRDKINFYKWTQFWVKENNFLCAVMSIDPIKPFVCINFLHGFCKIISRSTFVL